MKHHYLIRLRLYSAIFSSFLLLSPLACVTALAQGVNQTITFPDPSSITFGEASTVDLTATASSGLAVSYEITLGTSIATLNGDSVVVTGAGTVTVRATQEGDATFAPAAPVDRSFEVFKADQVITYFGETNTEGFQQTTKPTLPSGTAPDISGSGVIRDKSIGGGSFSLVSAVNSGIEVSYAIAPTNGILPASRPTKPTVQPVTIDNISGTITLSNNSSDSAQVILVPTAPASANYNALTAATAYAAGYYRSFTVRANQTISFNIDALQDKQLGDRAFTPVVNNAFTPVTISVTSGPAYVINPASNLISIYGIGYVNLRAIAPETSYNNSSPEAILYNADVSDQSFVVGGAEPSTGPGFFDLWTWRNPQESSTQNFNDIVANQNQSRIVAVGDSGRIKTTTDGLSWVTVSSGLTTAQLNGVTQNTNNGYVAVGDGRTILRSTNGISWSAVSVADVIPASVNLNSVATSFHDNSFLAVGVDTSDGRAVILSSTDGSTWVLESAPTLLRELKRVSYNHTYSRWIAVGMSGSVASRGLSGSISSWSAQRSVSVDLFGVHTAPDGKTYIVGENGTILSSVDPSFFLWTELFSGTDYDLTDIFTGNGFIVAVGENGRMLTSIDDNGEFWTESVSSFPLNMSGITYYLGLFYAAGQNYTIISSASGLEWTKRDSSTPFDFNGVAGNSIASIAVADGGRILRSVDDARTWSAVSSPTSVDLEGVAVNDSSIMIAVGADGHILRSGNNGATWSRVPNANIDNSSFSTSAFDSGLLDVLHDGQKFIAVGERRTILISDASGWNWTQLSGATPLNPISFNGIAQSDLNTLVIVGDGGLILLSNDLGSSWEGMASGVLENLESVTFGDDVFVAVGDDGRLLTSETGQNWQTQISTFFGNFRDVVFSNGAFVAVGEFLTFVASEDGFNWTAQPSGSLNYLNSVAVVNSQFIAVGEQYTILTATSVIPTGLDTWSLRNPLAIGSELNDVVFANDSFVAVGNAGRVLVSVDGKTWDEVEINETDGSPLTQDLYGVAYGNNKYVAVGDNKVVYSENGRNWSVLTTSGVPFTTNISFGNGLFVATGTGASVMPFVDPSIPGSFQNYFITHEPTEANLLDAYYSEELGLWVAVGEASPFPLGPDDEQSMSMVFTSTNGLNWTRHPTPLLPGETENYFTVTLQTAAYGDGRFILDGASGALGSFDGSNWFIETIGGPIMNEIVYTEANGLEGFFSVGDSGSIRGRYPFFVGFPGTTENLNGLAFGKQTFVAVGANGVILNSDDGRSWSIRSDVNLNDLNAVAVDSSGNYAAVGENGSILTSTDSLSWAVANEIPASVDSIDLFGVTSSDSGFVVVGENGTAVFSSNASEWTLTNTSVSDNLYDVAFGNGIYVGVGDGGVVITSTDGNNWIAQSSFTNQRLTSIAFANDLFLTAGNRGTVYTSPDGINWTEAMIPAAFSNVSFLGVGYGIIDGNGIWVISGRNGVVLRTANPISTNPNDWVQEVSGTTNDLYSVSFGVSNFLISGFDGTALTSNGSDNWFRRPTNTKFNLNGTIFFNGIFTAVGDSSTIITSRDLQPRPSQIINNISPAAGELEFRANAITLSAVAEDGLTGANTGIPVEFELLSGLASLSGNQLILNTDSPGTNVVVRFFNNGNSDYDPVSQNITYSIGEDSSSIVFDKIPNKLLSDEPFLISARTISGEDVDIAIRSQVGPDGNAANIASLRTFTETDNGGFNPVTRHQIILRGTDDAQGRVTLVASKDGEEATQSFYVSKFEQTITLVDPGPKKFQDADFNINASAAGGGEISFQLADESENAVATLRGTTISINRAGTITVIANAEPVGDYGPAEAELTIFVSKADQVLEFTEIDDLYAIAGATIPLRARTFINNNETAADPGQYPISYSIVKGNNIASITGDPGSEVITLSGERGQVTVQAAQAGDTNVNPAPAIEQSFSVSEFAQPLLQISDAINGSAFGNTRYVAVGENGLIARSLPSTGAATVNWEVVAGPTSLPLNDVAFGQGKFAAVGAGGTVLNSIDGLTWDIHSTNTADALTSVAFGNDRFVAGSSGGLAFYSDDGEDWVSTTVPTFNPILDVAYGLNPAGEPLFVGVGPVGTIITSPDGVSWTLRESGTQATLNGVAYGDGLFVIVSTARTYFFSDDGGIVWQRRLIPDGLALSTNDLNSGTFGNATFRVVGTSGLVFTATPQAIRTPEDASGNPLWVKNVSLGTENLLDASFGGDRFMLTGANGAILVSLPELALDARSYAVPDAPGVMWNEWMGFFNNTERPWIYHYYIGWLYLTGPNDNLWMYSVDLGWVWTNSTVFPSIYRSETSAWLYYYADTYDPRVFYDFSTDSVIYLP